MSEDEAESVLPLDADAAQAWDDLAGRPPRDIASLKQLWARTQPWEDGAAGSGDSGATLTLPDDSGGVWKVTTRSSAHIFDLDRMLYMRETSGGNSFAHDGRWCPLTRIETAPRVGEKFLIWLDDPDHPDVLEHWRVSSTITGIARVEPHQE